MIVLKIHESCYVEDDVIDAIQAERMSGNFDNCGTAVFLPSKGKDSFNFGSLRRGLLGIDQQISNPDLDCSTQRWIAKAPSKNGPQKIGRRCFAIRSSNRSGFQ